MGLSGSLSAVGEISHGREAEEPIASLAVADRYYEATLFDLAIPIYKSHLSVLHANSQERASARLKLASSYYLTGQYSKIPKVLEELESLNPGKSLATKNLDLEALFLLGLSYSKLKMYEAAQNIFIKYLSFAPQRELPLYADAQFELGKAYFEMQYYQEAKHWFGEIMPESNTFFYLSQLYLARIAAKEKNFSKAETILAKLGTEAPKEDVFPFAIAFLQGEIYFAQENWRAAIPWFKGTLPEKNSGKADWTGDSLYYSGWCHLNACEEEQDDRNQLEKDLQEAEKAFIALNEMHPGDRATLSLGQCYLSQSIYLNDPRAKERLEALLTDTRKYASKEAYLHSLMLRAEAASSYSERRKFFRQLTDESNKDSPDYASAWYLRGINEFEEGQREAIGGDKMDAKKHLEEAIDNLGKSFKLSFPAEKKMAALSLKYQVQANYYLKTREGYLKALALLGKILNQYRDSLFLELEDQGEMFFLQGLVAANLSEGEEANLFFTIAENSLLHNLESYPKGEFYDESRKLLATLYYSRQEFEKAEPLFLEIHKKNPESSYSGDALYWASNCSERKGDDPSKSKRFRKKVFEQYPDSPLAGEAMFLYFDFSDYVKGNTHALAHLTEFINRYPNSPYTLNALYLKGLNELQEKKSADGKIKSEKNIPRAIQYFTAVEAAFDTLYAKGLILEEKLEYFLEVFYRTKLEKALLYLILADEEKEKETKHSLNQAEIALQEIYADFENPGASFSSYFSKGPLANIQEESIFHLARCYAMAGDDDAALRLLEKKIEAYQASKITRGYYLSKSWAEMGKIASKKKNYEIAIQCFKNSEDAAKGKILRADELLELWIEESLCHQKLKEMDEAMLILSKVINYDAVSLKRLEAMFLRAEIYEEQGRLELARKQLEACASKGGRWAVKAKEKLEKNYAYQ